MQLNYTAKLAVAALVCGGVGVAAVGIARAELPQAPSRLATENDNDYILHMRSYRKQLEETKTSMAAEKLTDRAGHRQAAVDALDKAISEVNAEVESYDKDMKDGKGVK